MTHRTMLPLVLALLAARALAAGAQPSAAARPHFENGQAQVVPAFAHPDEWIRQELWVETEFDSDGDGRRDRVHVDVTRPRQTETEGLKLPVIYESSPYYAGTSGERRYLWDVRQELGAPPPPRTSQPPIAYRVTGPRISEAHVRDWVPRGFVVVHSESPGTGMSQGCPTVGGANESLAPKAVIDWLNGRAKGYTTADGDAPVVAHWATGKVGMTGTSYEGTLPIAAATTGVEGLEAIIPIAPNTSYYHYYRSNGLVRHPGGWLGEDIDFLYDFIASGPPERRDYCIRTVRDGELAAGRDRVSGDLNTFWEGRDYLRLADRIRAATLLAHGLEDWNVMPEHSVRVYRALRARGVPAMIYFHQGGHGGPPPFELMNRWFTRWLHGVENGVERDPRAWIVREDAPRNAPTPYADYPNPAASMVSLHPRAGRGTAIGALALVDRAGQGRRTIVDDVSFSGAALASRDDSPHRLLFATPRLATPLHLSGAARVTVRLASSKPAANLSVWLVSLPFDSTARARVITRGWADPQNHRSLTQGAPLVPGRFYTVSFELQPDDQIIPAGRQLGLMIFSSDRDFTLWPSPGTELTVDIDGTTLQLPVVGGAEAAGKAMRE
ncbi:MAG TPA: Xaa-Pro dipeptidyl-peptidase [Gemmatimonadaceae bacterium]|nr:Xaa-Pro dipeptidyl-peptidase [Gemmatimonadaceae bacterium]